MKKLIDIGNKIEEWFLVVLMAIVAVVVFIQVICRMIGSSLPWSEELTRYLTIWVTFVGASYGFRKNAHIGMDAFKAFLPERGRAFIELLGAILCVAISVLCIIFSSSILATQMNYGQVSPAMRIPMWIPYAAIPVGFALCALRNVGLAWQNLMALLGKAPMKEEEVK